MAKFWKYKLDHGLFWIITIGFHTYTRLYLIDKAGVNQFALEIIIRNSLLAMVIYTNLLLLIPHLLQRKKLLIHGLSLFGLLLSYAGLKDIHDAYLYGSVNNTPFQLLNNTFYNFSIASFYVAFSVGIHLSKEWFFQRELIQKIELEKAVTELAYLKNQINPHFLFNSLNTIYFQIDKTNHEAREALSQFSELLRFQLYECNHNLISLEKEINYLKNYVGLQRLRKDENYKIEFHVSGDTKNVEIAPLLLIPFVENAFKHISNFTNKSNEITIRITVNSPDFSFHIENTTEKKMNQESAGIGLKNVKRRLELQYPDNHTLSIRDTETTFEVGLKLRLI